MKVWTKVRLKDYNKKTREISEHLGNQVRIEDQKTKIIR